MGFREGAYAKVWEVTPMSDKSTKLQISITRKDKQTEEWVQEFSGFIMCLGTAAASKASRLKASESRIKIGRCDVDSKYVAEKKITYYNFKVFSFYTEDEEEFQSSRGASAGVATPTTPPPDEVSYQSDDDLPF